MAVNGFNHSFTADHDCERDGHFILAVEPPAAHWVEVRCLVCNALVNVCSHALTHVKSYDIDARPDQPIRVSVSLDTDDPEVVEALMQAAEAAGFVIVPQKDGKLIVAMEDMP